jgi:C4-dicarboxylate transporter DctM subunit
MEIGIIGVVVLVIVLFMGVYIGPAVICVGLFGLFILVGPQSALSTLSMKVLEVTNNFTFAVFPLFLLMGSLVSIGGIGRDAYEAARAWVGHLKGGLAMATMAACCLFAACCGNSLAGTVVMAKVAYPEMKNRGYSIGLASGCIAVGGTLGILIPPSMGFILIGVIAGLSIGKLFIAGIIPGITTMAFLMIGIWIMCKINPGWGPASPKTTMKEKMSVLGLTWPVAALFLLIIGGLYGGIFTALEAGAIGAFGALLILIIKKRINGKSLYETLIDAGVTTVMILIIMIGAYVFNAFLLITGLPGSIGAFVATLPLPTWAILFLVLLLYLILGTFLDIFAILIVTVPIMYPIMDSLGINLYWYSVLMAHCVELGLIAPPFGINLLTLKAIINVPAGVLYRGIAPYYVICVFNLAMLALLPQLSTFLIS